MDTRTWQSAKTMLADVADLPPAEQRAYIEQHCADPLLRAELLALIESPAVLSDVVARAATLTPGARLGPYEIVARIGAGGMGEVFKARDPRLGREVALKVLPLAVSTDTQRLGRFEREARAAAALNHPSIVTIYSVEEADGIRFMTMELVDGMPLSDRFPAHGLPVERVLEIAIALSEALGAAHARGIVHRDLKPANVMVTADQRIKILDFGLAKLKAPVESDALADAATSGLTADGHVLGTAAYMSPEQAQGHNVDHRSDIFSLGVLLYELLTGKRPFSGKATVSVLSSIVEDVPTPVTDVKPALPRELGRIIRRCLAKDPGRRYQSAIDLRNELEEVQQEVASGDLVDATASEENRRLRRLRAFAWIVGGVASLALAALGYLAWHRWPSNPPSTPAVLERVQKSIPFPDGVTGSADLAVSPDGSRISFVGNRQIWVHELATDNTRSVPGIVGTAPEFPFWSPNGQFIAYFQDGKLKKIPAAGGLPQDICEVAAGRGGSWNAEDTIIFAQSRDAIYRVPAAGGARAPVTTLDPGTREFAHMWPHFLPDGRHFTYVAWGEPFTVYIASLDAAENRRPLVRTESEAYAAAGFVLTTTGRTVRTLLRAQRLTANGIEAIGEVFPLARYLPQQGFTAHYAFAASGGVLAYRAVPLRRFQFSVVDASGATAAVGPPVLLDTNVSFGRPSWSLSPDGSTLALSQWAPDTGAASIWLLDLDRGNLAPLTSPTSGIESESPVWAPSGDRIVFTRRNGGSNAQDLYVRRLGTDVEARIGESNQSNKVPLDWHPDGRTLLFATQATPSALGNLWLLQTGEDRKPEPWLHATSNQTAGQFSPDGRWVAYVSNESGAGEVYVRRFPSAEGQQKISTAGGRWPQWRRDGKALLFVEGDTLLEVAIDTATGRPGRPRKLFTVGESPGYAVHPAGKHFVLCRPIDPPAPREVTVVVNWTAGLKRE